MTKTMGEMTKGMGERSDYPRFGYKCSLAWKISDEILLPKTDPKDHWFCSSINHWQKI